MVNVFNSFLVNRHRNPLLFPSTPYDIHPNARGTAALARFTRQTFRSLKPELAISLHTCIYCSLFLLLSNSRAFCINMFYQILSITFHLSFFTSMPVSVAFFLKLLTILHILFLCFAILLSDLSFTSYGVWSVPK